MTAAEIPSLLAFLLARLAEQEELVIRNTPIFVSADNIGVSEEFADHFLDRGALYQRVKSDRRLVSTVVDAMTDEQQSSVGHRGPVTALGSVILKDLAARYQEHPDYDSAWSLE